jgi:hypothetical protein
VLSSTRDMTKSKMVTFFNSFLLFVSL